MALIKCKKCGQETPKEEVFIYCPKCGNFLKPCVPYIVVGALCIIFSTWFLFFLSIHKINHLPIAISFTVIFLIGGIVFLSLGLGRKKIYQLSFGTVFILSGFGIIFLKPSLPVIIISVFFIVGGVLSIMGKLKTEEEFVAELPNSGAGGIWRKIIELKRGKDYRK